MRILRKSKCRFLGLICLLLMTTTYHLLHKKTVVISNEVPRVPELSKKETLNYMSLHDYAQNVNLNDFTFNEDDMRDEYDNKYTIMIWIRNPGKPGYQANPKECLDNISCEIVYASSNPESAHSIVFKSDYLRNANFPKTRNPHQHYVWWNEESPLHSSFPSDNLDHIFNLTFHYRTDADVYAPYGSINLILRELRAAGETDLASLLTKKRASNKMAAWAVSNCYSARMRYAKELMQAGLQVDTFGGCFGGRQIGGGRYSQSFYSSLSEYKFYFSFENSVNCKDYFTEKFWFNGLRSGAVPIVWGPRKSDLLKVAPTKSFIHADDFSSASELVKYLKYLTGNETAYAEYLEWRTWVGQPEKMEERLKMKNRDNDLRSFCKLCSIVQADGRRRKKKLVPQTRIVPSVKAAWSIPEKGMCHR